MGHQQAAGAGFRQQVGVVATPQGVEQSNTAAAAKQQSLQMWGRYSATLFMTLYWLDSGERRYLCRGMRLGVRQQGSFCFGKKPVKL